MIRNLKKSLAFTIVFAMLLSTVAFASPYPDVADDASYAEAVTTLSSLGLLMGDDEGNFNPDNTITRAEFAAVIVRTLGLGDPSPTATNFVDVPATHWGSGYIQMAAQMGIIAGYGDGNFGPEDPVTYEQAVKMIVAALGYTPKADALGGYPTGYMVVAAQERITAGVRATAGEPALRKIVAELVYNSLDVPLMIQTGWGTDVSYEPQDGNGRPYATILTQKLDVTKVEGVVVDNNATNNINKAKEDKTVKFKYTKKVDPTADLRDYKETVRVGKTNAMDLLGQTVVAYIRDIEETDAVILAIAPKSGQNVTFQVDIDDIVQITDDYIEYEDSDKDFEELDLDEEVAVVYNNVTRVINFNELKSNWRTYSGVIELLDNNDDGYYDYIFVKNYQNAVVDRVEASRNRIEYKSEFTSGRVQNVFDPDDKIEFVFILDGKEIELADLREWDVLSIMADSPRKDTAKVYTIYVTRKVVEGIVNETDDDEYYIDGTPYKLAANLYDGADPAVKLEDEGSFYLDMQGKIAAVDARSASVENYAILLQAALGNWDSYEVKLLTAEGKEVIYYTARTVRFNKITSNNPKDVLDWFVKEKFLAPGTYNHEKPAIITYRLNSSGDINRIDFVDYADPDVRNITTKDAYKAYQRTYDATEYSLKTFYLGSDTIVFDVRKIGGSYDPDKYVVTSRSFFRDDEVYSAIAYEVDRDDVAKVVFVTDGGDQSVIGSHIALVDRVTQTRNEDGDNVYRIYMLSDGEEVDYVTNAENELKLNLTGLNRGDVISFNLNARGEIDKIVTLLDITKTSADDSQIAAAAELFSENLGDDKVSIAYGKASGTVPNGARLKGIDFTIENGDVNRDDVKYNGPDALKIDEEMNISLRSADVYEFNIAKDRVFIESSGIIDEYYDTDYDDDNNLVAVPDREQEGSFVFLYMVEGRAEVAVVYTVQK